MEKYNTSNNQNASSPLKLVKMIGNNPDLTQLVTNTTVNSNTFLPSNKQEVTDKIFAFSGNPLINPGNYSLRPSSMAENSKFVRLQGRKIMRNIIHLRKNGCIP